MASVHLGVSNSGRIVGTNRSSVIPIVGSTRSAGSSLLRNIVVTGEGPIPVHGTSSSMLDFSMTCSGLRATVSADPAIDVSRGCTA